VIADRLGRTKTLGLFATLIAVFSGFAPTLLDGGALGQNVFILIGFGLLGLSYGQAAGAMNANFEPRYRYTGATLTSDLAWLIGAGFAPLVTLGLSSYFGTGYVSLYLLSGAAGTLAALWINRKLAERD
jgi:MFS family permease